MSDTTKVGSNGSVIFKLPSTGTQTQVGSSGSVAVKPSSTGTQTKVGSNGSVALAFKPSSTGTQSSYDTATFAPVFYKKLMESKPAEIPLVGRDTVLFNASSRVRSGTTAATGATNASASGSASTDQSKAVLSAEDFMVQDLGPELVSYVKSLSPAEGKSIWEKYAEYKAAGNIIGWTSAPGNGSFIYELAAKETIPGSVAAPGKTMLLDRAYISDPRRAVSQILNFQVTELAKYGAEWKAAVGGEDFDGTHTLEGADWAAPGNRVNLVGLAYMDAWLGPNFLSGGGAKATSSDPRTVIKPTTTSSPVSVDYGVNGEGFQKPALARMVGVLVADGWKIQFSDTVTSECIDIGVATKTLSISDLYQTRPDQLVPDLYSKLFNTIFKTIGNVNQDGLENYYKAYFAITANQQPIRKSDFRYTEVRHNFLLGLGSSFARRLESHLFADPGSDPFVLEPSSFIIGRYNGQSTIFGLIQKFRLTLQWNDTDKGSHWYSGVIKLDPTLKNASDKDICKAIQGIISNTTTIHAEESNDPASGSSVDETPAGEDPGKWKWW
jgi:hypothetical protein